MTTPNTNSRFYWTGIGSRATPPDICNVCTAIGYYFYRNGGILRSGGAVGADQAFEGTEIPPDAKEIYIPWGRPIPGQVLVPRAVYAEAEALAASVHPAWHNCNGTVRRLHTRNVCQILGPDLKTPSKFVLFWAPEVNNVVKGGTATAVHLARRFGIPTVNLATFSADHLQKLKEDITGDYPGGRIADHLGGSLPPGPGDRRLL